MKNITVTVTDEDGAVSVAELRVNVINQIQLQITSLNNQVRMVNRRLISSSRMLKSTSRTPSMAEPVSTLMERLEGTMI